MDAQLPICAGPSASAVMDSDDLLCTESVISHGSSSRTAENEPPVRFSMCAYDSTIYSDPRVLENLVDVQHKYMPSEDYLRPYKSYVTPNCRNVLVNWMSELCEHRCCEEQVFIVAVNLLDRFLSSTVVRRSQLQLTACVCMLVASKLRQCTYITVDDLSFYTEDSVTMTEIRQWEILVLAKLGWDVCPVTSIDFIEHLLNLIPELPHVSHVRKHALTYITLVATDTTFIPQLPSVIAAGAVCVAMEGLNINLPNAAHTMAQHLKCPYLEIRNCKTQIDAAIHRYTVQVNLLNSSPSDTTESSHFLCEEKIWTDPSSKMDGPVTPTDIANVQF